ncbi:nitroreductase family protein [Tetragenococcus koreensis]|uniref:Nitroreductase domain-containing protein n=1 Tax=Tetragenococcus koreensis TaxID=290335 RepID=A0AAN4RL64_9ENTE|nr:nitroreductase family protein [Tetragenococcus koreensis]AYW44946.1 nitroreductase family protein [Tetragenococcus koreensis]MCF1585527.1 nitroreductase family protein [Tetragenococcus koreensis]MCF1615044.1 nitroreductase family protein [Tetragenococcus koreensis]MCF1616435.1 nitroreductase family protein [Tetragenococcus koreensis]MCF1619233.1 nitroreductase family protein [Tetragenococcus koreensis]
MTNFLNTIKNRRSIYSLGRNTFLSETEIMDLIKEAVKQSPSAFNAQEPRIITLFGDAHEKLWELTEQALEPLTPAEAFENTKQKLAGFKAGLGTAMFFNDVDTTKQLQEQFTLYADNFPAWAEQANGIATANTWTTLAEAGIGANLQHYNPVIDEAVANEWDVPSNWRLRSQLVFGSPEGQAGEKVFLADDERFKVFK